MEEVWIAPGMSRADRDRVLLRMVEEGYQKQAIAKKFGVAPETVSRWLKRIRERGAA